MPSPPVERARNGPWGLSAALARSTSLTPDRIIARSPTRAVLEGHHPAYPWTVAPFRGPAKVFRRPCPVMMNKRGRTRP